MISAFLSACARALSWSREEQTTSSHDSSDLSRARLVLWPLAALAMYACAAGEVESAAREAGEIEARYQALASLGRPEVGMVTPSDSFNVPNGTRSCTGTAVAPNVVLTSKSCAQEVGYFYLLLGPMDVRRASYRLAYRAIRHDIALLYLTNGTSPSYLPLRAYAAQGDGAEWWSVGAECRKQFGDFSVSGASISPAVSCRTQAPGGPVIRKYDGMVFGVMNDQGGFENLGDIWEEIHYALEDVRQGFSAGPQTLHLEPRSENARSRCAHQTERYLCSWEEAWDAQRACTSTGIPLGEITLSSAAHWCRRPLDPRDGPPVYTNEAQCRTPLPGTCQFYRECLNVDGIGKNCGEKSYALSYGEKYCFRFKHHDQLSEEGNRWRDKTLACLQRQIANRLDDIKRMTCDEITDFAFQTHEDCYISNPSVCTLSLADQESIYSTVDQDDVWTARAKDQTVRVLRDCAWQTVTHPTDPQFPNPPGQPPCNVASPNTCADGLTCNAGNCVGYHPFPGQSPPPPVPPPAPSPPPPGPAPVPPPPPPPPAGTPLRIMAIGDSITHSENGHYSWRYRLHEHLRAARVSFDFVGPHNRPFGDGSYAVEGWDSDHYAKWGCIAQEIVFPEEAKKWGELGCDPGFTVADRVRTYQPHLLLVHLGSNDMGWRMGPEAARDVMRGLIDLARSAKPDIQIIFAQIGQVSLFHDSPYAAQFATLMANLAAEKTTSTSRIAVAAVHPAWQMGRDTDEGGTHPNMRGEYVIAKAFADSLSANFGVGRPFGEIPLNVGPPKVTGIGVSPSSISLQQPFTVSWPRVTNPGIWTTYKVQVRYHKNFGFGLVWESQETPDLSVTYNGPPLPQAGVFHLVVVSTDGTYQTPSDPVPLEVRVGPPKVTGISVPNEPVALGQPFTVSWPRVVNPGVWTTYKVQVRYHHNFGFGLVWESTETPNLSVSYDGPRLPQTGVYDVVVVSTDGTYQTSSDPVPLSVREAGPPKPAGITLSPSIVTRGQTFAVSWPRVVNPGVWTTYKVQVRYHQNFGFGLVWESAETPNLSVLYTGSSLPQAGIYHVVVVALDGTYSTPSDPVPLDVRDGQGPPKVTGIQLSPSSVPVGTQFRVSWPRVNNPGVWTTYRVELHQHQAFGFGLVWRSPEMTETSVVYGGPALDAGVYHVVVYSMDGTYETGSDLIPLEVYGSDAAP